MVDLRPAFPWGKVAAAVPRKAADGRVACSEVYYSDLFLM